MPWYLVRKAHLEIALVACDMWIGIFALFVDLAAVAGAVEAVSEVGLFRQVRQEAVVVISTS